MKKTLQLALAGAALMSCCAANAQESYVAVGVGQSEYSAGGANEHKTALSFAYGQSLSQNWGYELGYINFGKLSGAGTDPVSGDTVSATLRSQAVYVSGVGTLQLGESFAAFGKLGVASVYTKADATLSNSSGSRSGSGSETEAKLMAGLGLSYRFNKEWAATLEYQYFGKVADDNIRLTAWTAGLRYGF